MSRLVEPRWRLHGWLQGRYRKRRIREFAQPDVGEKALAFDIGANVGEWSAALRQLGADVVAIEPQGSCVDSLREQFAQDAHVHVVEKAVGDRPGTGALTLAATSTEHASMSAEWRSTSIEKGFMPADAWLDPVEVEVTTLDVLIDEFGQPAFCKIDVEGLEPEVLSGLSLALPAVAFEFHRELDGAIQASIDRLSSLGDYRYAIYLGEWPELLDEGLTGDAVLPRIRGLKPKTWGMIKAQLRA